MKKKTLKIEANPLYHDTWKLLENYRDVVWSLERSVQQAQRKIQLEYGSSVEEFLDTIYVAGADLSGGHNGETYYWVLYYSFLSAQQLRNVDEIVEALRCAHIGY